MEMELSQLSIKKLNHIIRAKATKLSGDDGKNLLQRRSQVYEKDELVALCLEYIDQSEIEMLLEASISTNTSSSPKSATSNTTTSSAGNSMGVADMSPDQLRQQAQAMKQNPSAFRFMQTPPLTEAQVLEAASQMETMANNPALFQQMKDQMANMSPDEMERLRNQYQGHKYGGSSSSTRSSSNSLGDEVDRFLNMLQSDPDQALAFIKMQPGMSGFSDEVLKQQLDSFRNMDPALLKQVLSYAKPLATYYQKLDAATGGRGKYVAYVMGAIVLLLGLCLVYIAWRVVWACIGYFVGWDSSNSIRGATDSNVYEESHTTAENIAPKSFSFGTHNDDNDEFEF